MSLWKIVACLLLTAGAAKAEDTFLALSDVHYGVRAISGKWGHGNETSLVLWQNAQAKAIDLIAKQAPKFTVYLGDMPAHSEPEATRKQEFTTVLGGLAHIAGPSHRLYFLPGNNDTNAGDYCQFTDNQDETPFASAHSGNWPALNAMDTLIDRSGLAQGYYSAYPLGKNDTSLRLITLNTVMFNANYGHGFHWTPCQPYMTDAEIQMAASIQLSWLAQQLADAQANNERTLIAMHVPPGMDGHGGSPMWNPDLTYHDPTPPKLLSTVTASVPKGSSVETIFSEVISAYSDQITGILTAHTHLDDMRRLWTCKGDLVGLAIGIPGITTDHGNNPAMKLFSYDSRKNITDATTYYASETTGHNWVDANRYGFSKTYCPPSQDCAGMDLFSIISAWPKSQTQKLAKRMEQVLKTKRSPVSGRYYAQAMDAYPQCD